MPPGPVDVSWQVADDEAMTRIVRSGTAIAEEAWAHSVHVEVDGLRPDRWYWYRFKVGGELSPTGRTRTAPVADTMPERLRFAVANCQKYEVGYFTAFEHLAREELDLVVHLGDYIYEDGDDRAGVRPHHTPEAVTLDAYRARYALYKLDPALQLAHAVAPWIVTWDDHEVDNNYAGAIPSRPERTTPEAFLQRRADGYQAYYEHLPLRRSARPIGPDMQLFRKLSYGRLADFHVLDTRQYRTDQPLGDGEKPPGPELMVPAGTILGERQRAWLFDGLERSPAAWNILAQQVLVARVDHRVGPEVIHKMDKWPGYEFERRRLLRHFHDRRIRNPVVLTGDIHTNWANELIADFDGLDSRSVAVEFVATSLTSGGNGGEFAQNHAALLAENPFVKFHNRERGYIHCEVTPDTWRADYRTVPYVDRPGAPLNARASFLVESGRPRLNRV
jgi:alkaline phosphatase D